MTYVRERDRRENKKNKEEHYYNENVCCCDIVFTLEVPRVTLGRHGPSPATSWRHRVASTQCCLRHTVPCAGTPATTSAGSAHAHRPAEQLGSVLGSWGKPMRDAVRNKERWERRRTPTQDPSTYRVVLGVAAPVLQRVVVYGHLDAQHNKRV